MVRIMDNANPKPSNPFHVAVIGAGASGTLVAAQFKKLAPSCGRLALIGNQARPARGVAIGANGASLPFDNVRTTDAGSYTVTVANLAGSVTSNPAQLTVLPLEILPPSALVNGRIQFSFDTAVGASYEVQFSTNLVDWYPWLDVDGSGQPFKLTDPSAGSGAGVRFYRVMITPP